MISRRAIASVHRVSLISLAMAASALTTSAAAAGAATPAAGGAAVAAAGVTVSRPVSALVASKKTREGAGFIVRRPLGGGTGVFDPFLMLDHFGPVTSKPGEAVGAPDHPHRGFTTVSYILSGEMEHRDSTGTTGKLSAGWVQFMDAARGVVHSETPSEAFQKTGGTMEGFQIWVNLPKANKMDAPRYQDVPPEKIPTAAIPGAASAESIVKVVAGSSCGITGPVETKTPIVYLDVHLKAGDKLVQEVPADHNVLVYVYRGKALLGADKKAAEEGHMAKFTASAATGIEIAAAADSDTKVLLLAGRPIGEPVVSYGPFVMNTEEEIYQAFEDYRSGKLGSIEGSEERYAASDAAKAKQKKSGTWAAGDREL